VLYVAKISEISGNFRCFLPGNKDSNPCLEDPDFLFLAKIACGYLNRTAATAAALLLDQPASDPQSHLAARSASSCDWVNFRELPLVMHSPEGAEKQRTP
jgi:hypothetical protein